MWERILDFTFDFKAVIDKYQFSGNSPKFHKFTKIVIFFKDIWKKIGQLLLPYKFYDRDMLEFYFFIFANCEPFT